MTSGAWVRKYGTALETYGEWIAATAAVLASLPGLGFPFLSDDWLLVSRAAGPRPSFAAYGYFRPLYTSTFWIDRHIAGVSPAFFHLTNLLLIAACAALVTRLVRCMTKDGSTALLAGLLFALHPYHVENAAWVAVRGDPLYSVFFLLAILAYEAWARPGAPEAEGPQDTGRPAASSSLGAAGPRRRLRDAVPWGALALCEAALLAKETAIVLPLALGAIVVMARGRVGARREWWRGLAPMLALAGAHIFVVRPLALHLAAGGERTLTPGDLGGWVRHAIGFAVAALVPVDGEILAARPLLWGGVAALASIALLATAWVRAGRLPRRALAGGLLFGILLLPSIVGFQERYLFLPAAASGLALAVLIRSAGGWPARVMFAAIAAAWIVGIAGHWQNWGAAARASRSLVRGLVAVSQRPGVSEIALANAPFRVRGASVAGDFGKAVALSGGKPVPVRAAAYVSYRDDAAPTLVMPEPDTVIGEFVEPSFAEQEQARRTRSRWSGMDRGEPMPVGSPARFQRWAPEEALEQPDGSTSAIDVTLRTTEGLFSHYVGPYPPPGQNHVDVPLGRLEFGKGIVRIRILKLPGREIVAWYGGEVHVLPGPTMPSPRPPLPR